MTFVPFEMERWQSTYEHQVELNLSESGVHPLTLAELLELTGTAASELESVLLEYIQSNGQASLRERIAAFHPGTGVENVVVTNGSAEANFLASWELCRPGQAVVFMEPNYFQIHGVAENLGATVREWWLDEDAGWDADLAGLDRLMDNSVSAIVVTNPNNPTGRRFGAAFIDAVIERAERHGAWIVADEVYRGAEIDGVETPSFAGKYDRAIVTGGLSKAYGLPGLRLGWAVTSEEMATRLWSRKDYTTISAGALNAFLGERALRPDVRAALLERTRGRIQRSLPILDRWIGERNGFSYTRPEAGAIALVHYDLPIAAEVLTERLRAEQDCLLVPGSQFRIDSALRIGTGPPPEAFQEGLRRLATMIETVAAELPDARVQV